MPKQAVWIQEVSFPAALNFRARDEEKMDKARGD
jgi:hypothetical protein